MPDTPDIESLIGTLQGTIGRSPMQSLSPLGQFGAALAGFGAGVQGKENPVLAQIQGQQDAQLRQQVQMMQLQQSVQRQRQEKFKLNLEMNHAMLEAAKDPETRTILSQQRRDLFNQSGLQVPPGMVQAWTSKQYKPDQEKQFVMAFLGREQDPNALRDVAQQFGLPDDQAAYYQRLSGNDRYLAAAGLPTRASMQKEQLDIQKKKAETWIGTHPQFKDAGSLHGVAGYADEFVRRVYNQGLYDLTSDNPDDAKKLTAAVTYAQKRAQLAFIRDKQEESDIIKQREIDVATAKSKLKGQEPKPMSQRERTLVFKPFDVVDTAMADLGAMKGAATRLNAQGYLAKDTSFLSQKYAQALTFWYKSGDPDVLLLKQLTAPVTIGLVDRGLHDEKGTRAMQMFHEQIRIVSQFPTLEGYQRLFGFYEYLFGRMAAKQLRRIEHQIGKIPDDVVEEAQRTFLELFPKGLPTDPTRPLGAPKGYQGP